MGAELGALRRHWSPEVFRNSPLLDLPLARLRDHFCAFKALCDGFHLDIDDFERVFPGQRASFDVWDQAQNGLVDCFELFAGLVLLANAPLEDKARFLFELVDLNEAGRITAVEVEFALCSSLASLRKLLRLREEVAVEEVAAFVAARLGATEDITAVRFAEFAAQPDIAQFVAALRPASQHQH